MTTMQSIHLSAFSVCGSNGLMVTSNYLTRRYFLTDITTGDSLNDLKRNDSYIDLKRNDSYIDLKRSDSYSELNLGLVNGDILSVESMLSRNVVVYDFDITSVKSVAGDLKEGRKSLVIRETLLDYSKLFDELSCDPSSVGLKLKFYVMRLKLDTFLVEGLLRDFIKRCRLHMRMLAKTNCSLYYMEQSRLLLSEIAKFKSKQSRVFKHIDDAILHYRSSSDGEFHLLEREIFHLREKVILKGLLGKLNKSLTLLESELQDGVSDSDFGSDSGSLIRAEVVNPALAPRFLCFSSFLLSGPSSSVHPWYDSDWMIIVACGVIILGAAYFLRKRNDDGDDGHGGEPGSISGITSSKGLLDLLPSQDASSSDSDNDFLWWDLGEEIEVGRFAASPGYGESSVGLLTKGFAVFPYGILHLILVCVSK